MSFIKTNHNDFMWNGKCSIAEIIKNTENDKKFANLIKVFWAFKLDVHKYLTNKV